MATVLTGTTRSTGTASGPTGDEIVLEGREGVEPSPIEGEENSTLVLSAGREYELIRENADAAPHNFEICSAEDELLADTADLRGADERLSITVEIAGEMPE